MTEREQNLERRLNDALAALHQMVEQYCDTGKKTEDGKSIYNDLCMTAGEDACQVLKNEGRITEDQWE